MKTWDVIIIGGGIIGLSLSIALRKRGATVLVVERGEPGREASYAAGGMLVDCALETPSILQDLASASARMYPEFALELEVESGMKVDLREYGTILLSSAESLKDRPEIVAVDSAQLLEREPALGKMHSGQEAATSTTSPLRTYYLKERSVDPRALVAAAIKAAKNRGVDFSSGDEVTTVEVEHSRAIGIKTAKTAFAAHKVVNCAGAWAGSIGPHVIPTRPVKGQMLCLLLPSRTLLKHVIRSPQAYLIPRSDGRLLVGATVEEVGFDKRTFPNTIQRLHRSALELVPKLADAKIHEDWAGLRPGTPDALPILGPTSTSGYYVATGHFRDGILLAPITAQVMSDVIEDRKPQFELAPYSPSRF